MREAILWGTGAVMPQMSEVFCAPLAGFYPVPCFPLSCSAGSAHCGRLSRCLPDQTYGHHVWLAVVCCQKQRWQMSSAHLPGGHQPVSDSLGPKGNELCLIFLSYCWMWENWSMRSGKRTDHWNNSIICKPAMPKKLRLVMKQGQNHPSSSPRSHN